MIKKNRFLYIFLSCLVFLILITIIAPVIQIGNSSRYIDLHSGEEIVVTKYLWGLIKKESVEMTVLTDSWPTKMSKSNNKRIIISEKDMYLFSSRYITHKNSHEYYDIKSKCLLLSQEKRCSLIKSFMKSCMGQ